MGLAGPVGKGGGPNVPSNVARETDKVFYAAGFCNSLVFFICGLVRWTVLDTCPDRARQWQLTRLCTPEFSAAVHCRLDVRVVLVPSDPGIASLEYNVLMELRQNYSPAVRPRSGRLPKP